MDRGYRQRLAFLAARCVLAIGESGNFPAAIKITAEYFPKKDRGFATSVFNSGAQIRSFAGSFRHTFAGPLLGLGDVLPLGGCRGLRLDGSLGVCV